MPATQTLQIQHIAKTDPPQFQVVRVRGDDVKRCEAATVTPPAQVPVAGRPQSNLAHELRWYLEWFLDYPFPPETEHAANVQAALHGWGRDAFQALFDNMQAGGFYQQALAGGHEHLLLQISSDDPRILA